MIEMRIGILYGYRGEENRGSLGSKLDGITNQITFLEYNGPVYKTSNNTSLGCNGHGVLFWE